MDTKPVHLKNSTPSPVTEKRSHFHVADEWLGISTKAADDSRFAVLAKLSK
jgi:hypothetical protein